MEDLVAKFVVGVLSGLALFFGGITYRQSGRRDVKVSAQDDEIASMKKSLETFKNNSRAQEKLIVDQAKKIQELESQQQNEKNIQERLMVELSNKIKALENELSVTKSELASTKNDLNSVNAQFVNISKQRDEMSEKIKALSTEVNELRHDLTVSETKNAVLSDIIGKVLGNATFTMTDKIGTGELKAVEPKKATSE